MNQRRMVDGRQLILVADASPTIGTGHAMRLMALGQAWIEAGGHASAVLASAPEPVADQLRARGLDVDTSPNRPRETWATRLRRHLREDPDARAAVDAPALAAADLDSLAETADRVLVVDDEARLPRYPVGLVLNQNSHADRASYPPVGGARYLLGLDYVILRPEFRRGALRRSVPDVAGQILLTAGGADPMGMTARGIDALDRLPSDFRTSLSVDIVVGAANPAFASIQLAAERSALRMNVTRAVSDMVDRMARADLAITSGGTTVWELARTGCPSLVVETGPAEHMLAAGLDRFGLFDRLGDLGSLGPDEFSRAIGDRIGDREWRQNMADLGPRLIDGQGVERVIAALVSGELQSNGDR